MRLKITIFDIDFMNVINYNSIEENCVFTHFHQIGGWLWKLRETII